MNTKIIPEKLYWASFNRFEMRLPGQCVLDCSHSGQCDANVAAWTDRIKTQIESDDFPNKPTPYRIRIELKEYGTLSKEELADDKENFARIFWFAVGNIADDPAPDCSEPLKN